MPEQAPDEDDETYELRVEAWDDDDEEDKNEESSEEPELVGCCLLRSGFC